MLLTCIASAANWFIEGHAICYHVYMWNSTRMLLGCLASTTSWFIEGHAISYHVYVIVHVKDPSCL